MQNPILALLPPSGPSPQARHQGASAASRVGQLCLDVSQSNTEYRSHAWASTTSDDMLACFESFHDRLSPCNTQRQLLGSTSSVPRNATIAAVLQARQGSPAPTASLFQRHGSQKEKEKAEIFQYSKGATPTQETTRFRNAIRNPCPRPGCNAGENTKEMVPLVLRHCFQLLRLFCLGIWRCPRFWL